MKLSEFEYSIPDHAIAQFPASVRDQSRLLVLNRRTGGIEHRLFSDLPEFLEPGSLLVLNDTRVFPSRLTGSKETGGKTEILLLRQRSSFEWEALYRGRFRKSQKVYLTGGLEGTLQENLEDGKVAVAFKEEAPEVTRHFLIHGEPPLPPYIKRDNGRFLKEDHEAYQTVYAKGYGSVAAPTAGLHFTEALLSRIRNKGVEIVTLTLQVGVGTFKPVTCEEIENHRMDSEAFTVTEAAARSIRLAKEEKRKVVAVGTTSTRTLETLAGREGGVRGGSGTTSLFIYPGYSFKVVDALVTNFHLSRSTLLMLVSAFAGREQILKTYEIALNENYRFYSYGDAMFILQGESQ
jgi:S-adenosylmethionine:tRNA ribosyltransferase-isomerase